MRKHVDVQASLARAVGMDIDETMAKSVAPVGDQRMARTFRRQATKLQKKRLAKGQRDADKRTAAMVADLRADHDDYVEQEIRAAEAAGLLVR